MENKFPELSPLAEGTYSLETDLRLGWRPKTLTCGGPIPLVFSHNQLPSTRDLLKFVRNSAVYYGFRPADSYVMHKLFSKAPGGYFYNFESPLISVIEHLSKKNQSKLENSGRSWIGMRPSVSEESIHFDSFFEGGNLDKAVIVSNSEYDLYMRVDANTRGHYKWFYFKATNLSQDRAVKFNIVNFRLRNNLLQQGMRPVYYSEFEKEWKQLPEECTYKSSKLNKFVRKGTYYMLSFTHYFREQESVYFALTIPYTFSQLNNYLKELPAEVSDLCQTLSGVKVPLVTVTDTTKPDQDKKFIIVVGRVHPSETASSYVTQGFLDFITGEKDTAKHLKKKFIFKVVPMSNPDGVIMGNSRTSFTGEDLNRVYCSPDRILHPVPYYVKQLAHTCAKTNKGLFLFLDIHAHFTKKNSFFYGPYFPLHTNNYYYVRMLPKIFSCKTPMVRFFSCKFRNEKSKKEAARLCISRELNMVYCYTLENSLYGYIDQERNTIWYSIQNYFKVGIQCAKAIDDFYYLLKYENHDLSKSVTLKDSKSQLPLAKTQKAPRSLNYSISDLKQIIEQEKVDSSSESDSQSESDDDLPTSKDFVINALKEFQSIMQNKTACKPVTSKSTACIKQSKKYAKSKSPQKLKSNALLPSVHKEKLTKDHSKSCKAKSKHKRKKANEFLETYSTPASTTIMFPASPSKLEKDSSFEHLAKKRTPPHFAISFYGGRRKLTDRSELPEPETKNACSRINLTDLIENKQPAKPTRNFKHIRRDAKYHRFGPFPVMPINRS